MGDWSNLPDDLLEVIARKLTFIPDLNRFACVCVQWRKVARSIHGMFPSLPPLLMLPCNDVIGTCNFFSPLDKVLHNVHLPEIHNRWICGASNGWLATVDDHWEVFLFNPFSRAQIQLPRHPRITKHEHCIIPDSPPIWRSEYMNKIIISADPASSSDWVAVALVTYPMCLAFFRAGDSEWTTIQAKNHEFSDVQFYQGRLYAVMRYWNLLVLDVRPEPKFVEMRTPFNDMGRNYLVECSADLLYIRRFADGDRGETPFWKTYNFHVYKVTPDTREWTRVESLGDCSLFLGGSQSLCVSVRDCPGYRSNCIYFTDDYYQGIQSGTGGHLDSGVFSLEDGRIEPLYFDEFPFWPSPAFWCLQCP